MYKNEAKLTLVGAGPGDPDLLTIKGAKALHTADVILYDALANADLLDHAPATTLKVFVGKRKGQHSFTQDEINQLIVHYANEYGHVVRLKGGDPFVFGRGSEEIAYAEAHGIPTSVVPGISSAYGVPASIGIPLTARGISESFWVITGTTSSDQLSRDINLALQSSATIVVLMGMAKLEEIVQEVKDFGKGEIPMAIIQNGTTEQEKHCMGNASDIVSLVEEHQLANPAIIVIGEVVQCSNAWIKIKKQLQYAS